MPLRARIYKTLADAAPGLGRARSRFQRSLYEATGGRRGAKLSGAPVMLLETRGRRSGQLRVTPVIYARRGDDLLVLPASGGSERPPAWWLNLRDAGEGVATLGTERRRVRARALEGEELEAAWRLYDPVYPDGKEMCELSEREIPLVALEAEGEDTDRDWVVRRRQEAWRQLGERREVELPAHGRLAYHERGEGPPVLLLHGLWVNADLWRKVVPELAESHRCIAPDLPFGAHLQGLREDADLSAEGIASLLRDLLDALGIDEVTLVANDTGDAYAQVLATTHPQRVARLVLTPGDAFSNFLPPAIRPMRVAMQSPAMAKRIAAFWRTGFGKRLIMGPLTKRRPPEDVLDSYFAPAAMFDDVRRDLAKLLSHAKPSVTRAAAKKLPLFGRPALVVWTKRGNLVFPRAHGRKLAKLLDADLELVSDSFAFVPEDQPQRLAELIAGFVASSPVRGGDRPPSGVAAGNGAARAAK